MNKSIGSFTRCVHDAVAKTEVLNESVINKRPRGSSLAKELMEIRSLIENQASLVTSIKGLTRAQSISKTIDENDKDKREDENK